MDAVRVDAGIYDRMFSIRYSDMFEKPGGGDAAASGEELMQVCVIDFISGIVVYDPLMKPTKPGMGTWWTFAASNTTLPTRIDTASIFSIARGMLSV